MIKEHLPTWYVKKLLSKFPDLEYVLAVDNYEVQGEWKIQCPGGHDAYVIECATEDGTFGWFLLCAVCGKYRTIGYSPL